MVKQKEINLSRNKVKNAGKDIRNDKNNSDAKIIIQDFRSAHIQPLDTLTTLIRRNSKKISNKSIVAQRLKRLPTIIDKLKRFKSMQLPTMGDIGGCRVIFGNKEKVYKLLDRLKKSKSQHTIIKTKDYIENPKDSGYRSLHLIYKMYDKKDKHRYKGYKIELQIRTKVQHAWATAVEMVDMFEAKDLKTNQTPNNNDDWSNFFYLLGKLFAVYEGAESVEESQYKKLKKELKEINETLNAYTKIQSYNLLTENINQKDNNKYIIAYLKYEENSSIYLEDFKKGEEAEIIYRKKEDDSNISYVVMTSLTDLDNFKKAYPNFFADTREFIKIFSDIILFDGISLKV